MPKFPAVSRRSLMGGAVATGAAMAIGSTAPAVSAVPSASAPRRRPGQKTMVNVRYDAYSTVRVGVIGLGNRGAGMSLG